MGINKLYILYVIVLQLMTSSIARPKFGKKFMSGWGCGCSKSVSLKKKYHLHKKIIFIFYTITKYYFIKKNINIHTCDFFLIMSPPQSLEQWLLKLQQLLVVIAIVYPFIKLQ